MAPTPDELAGVVDGFGGLTRTELRGALDDLAARAGDTTDTGAVETAIDGALDSYHLLELSTEEALVSPGEHDVVEPLLLPGPPALPELPEGGDDLPHLLDIEPRAIDREAVARSVESSLRADAAAAIEDDDVDRAARLLDACYEVEAWGPVDLADAKAGLADVIE